MLIHREKSENPGHAPTKFECNYINTAHNRQPEQSCKSTAHMVLSLGAVMRNTYDS